MSSGYKADPAACANVYHTWKSARDALSQSIQSYVVACDSLTSVSVDTITQAITASGSSESDALSVIDVELSGLIYEEKRLRKARVALLESRNRSKASSAINTFPAEILSFIFLAAKPNPPYDRRSRYPTAISSVCRFWRRLALSLPSMWSDLYYVIDGALQVNTHKFAELCNGRAGESLRYIEMVQLDSGVNLDSANDALYDSLGAQASRTECLYLECTRHFIQCALICWMTVGTPGVTKVLQLHNDHGTDESHHILSWHRDIAHEAPPSNRTTEFLSSVRFLELRNVYFSWNSSAYHNLLELSLNLSDGSFFNAHCLPTQHEMKTILSASPMLHTLAIKLTSSLQERQSSIEPIRLNNLQHLTLAAYNSLGCLGLLPLIEPGPKRLNMVVSGHSDSAFVQELNSFFRRSTITALRIKPVNADSWFKLLSKNLSRLESLTLDSCDFRDRDLSAFINAPSTLGSYTSPWPKLHTVELDSCKINGASLQHILPINSIHTIRFYGGFIIDLPPHAQVTADSKFTAMGELEQTLSALVPDTKSLPYRYFPWLC